MLDAFLGRLAGERDNPVSEVWLFGSRARGEQPGPLSDIDLLVFAERGGLADTKSIFDALHAAARDSGHPTTAWMFSLHVHEPSWLPRRRAVGSPFVEELERDHISVHRA